MNDRLAEECLQVALDKRLDLDDRAFAIYRLDDLIAKGHRVEHQRGDGKGDELRAMAYRCANSIEGCKVAS